VADCQHGNRPRTPRRRAHLEQKVNIRPAVSRLCKCAKSLRRALIGKRQLDHRGLEEVWEDCPVGYQTPGLRDDVVALEEVLHAAAIIDAQIPGAKRASGKRSIRIIVRVLPEGLLVCVQGKARVAS
jgi:hypothetical protein